MRDRSRACSARGARVVASVALAVIGCSSSDPAAADPQAADLASAPASPPGAASPPGVATPPGASSPASAPDASADATPPCTGSAPFRCSADGMSRSKCASGATVTESCARGCLRSGSSSEDTCMGATTSWSCPGSYGTTKAQNGDYYLTAFGCWVDAAGTAHGDAGDNCIPTCLAQAKAAGLCMSGDTGKDCEERVTWFTADAARFGCLARVRVTNPANGKSVVAVALDYGPSCKSVEDTVSKAVLDASGRVDRALFGSDEGVSDHAAVHVVEVDPSTPLGP
jgi:hypothetical protein